MWPCSRDDAQRFGEHQDRHHGERFEASFFWISRVEESMEQHCFSRLHALGQAFSFEHGVL